MKVYSVLRKGESHPVFCEDFLIAESLLGPYQLFAVMDGCSSGQDSHFASTLIGKLLVKIIRQIRKSEGLLLVFSRNQPSVEYITRVVIQKLREELTIIIENLDLSIAEVLSTLTLMIYDDEKNQAYILVLGDGVIAINHEVTIIDQNNQPEYLAYYLEDKFELWYAQQKHKFFVDNPRDISISSDGIESFRTLNPNIPEDFDPIHYLLVDNYLENNIQMLSRKTNILQSQYGFLPADDLSIVRVVF